MSRLFLLVRVCSMYTEADIVLGCFRSNELAMTAKNEYIAHVEKHGDAHAIQGYMHVCLEDDLRIEHIDVEIVKDTRSIFLLFQESDAFGQLCRELKYATCDFDDLNKFAKSNPLVEDGFPMCFMYDEIVLDSLRYENTTDVLD